MKQNSEDILYKSSHVFYINLLMKQNSDDILYKANYLK